MDVQAPPQFNKGDLKIHPRPQKSWLKSTVVFFFYTFQIWIWQRNVPNSEAWKCLVFWSKIPLCQFQDLLQFSCRWKGALDYLCFQCGWREHSCSPVGWEDILCGATHQYHVPQIQGRQRLHCPRDPLCHGHQRHEGNICLWFVRRETDQRKLWFKNFPICSCHVIIQYERPTFIFVGRWPFNALSYAVFISYIQPVTGCILFPSGNFSSLAPFLSQQKTIFKGSQVLGYRTLMTWVWCSLNSDSLEENNRLEVKTAEICWLLHKLAGPVTSPSSGLVFPTGNMKGLAKMMGEIFSTCREFCDSWLLLLSPLLYIWSWVLVFSHVRSKLTSELISLIAWAMNS